MRSSDGEQAGGPAEPTNTSGRLIDVSFVLGAAALLLAMGSDAAAVIGRHLGLPFLGSIELVQACVVVASSSAMVCATLWGAHATVHIVLERLSPRGRSWLEALGSLAGAACFLILATGSVWLVHDLWGGREETELLRIPLMPLRLFWCASSLLVCGLFLGKAIGALRAERVR